MAKQIKDRVENIEALLAQIHSAADAGTRSAALEVIETMMEFHRAAIDRMMEIAAEAGEPGWSIIDNLGRDELVSHLLLLHGLHPLDLAARVRGALEKVRPYLRSHGGNVELVNITDSVVNLRLIGSCNGCPSSSLTLKTAIEKSIYEAAPDVAAINCERASELIGIHNAA